MPFQIETFSVKQLLFSYDRETVILNHYWKEEVRLGDMQEVEMNIAKAKRKAIRKALEQMGKEKKTNIHGEQIKLF